MFFLNEQVEMAGLKNAAKFLCIAARTAPKGKGKDLLVPVIVASEKKDQLQQQMRLIGDRDGIPFFLRDAENFDHAPVVVLIGTRKQALRIPACSFCGFVDCDAMSAAGGTCSFTTGNLGIAVGSAAAMAADFRIDNRIMSSIGKAAIELGMLGEKVAIA